MRWLKFSCFELLRSLELFAGPSSDHDFAECFQANDFSLVHWRLRIPGLHFFCGISWCESNDPPESVGNKELLLLLLLVHQSGNYLLLITYFHNNNT